MDPHLQFVLAQVNDWLKFAEAKNGALVVTAGGATVAVSQAFPSPGESPILSAYLITAAVFFCSSALIALMSFLPRTQIPKRFLGPASPGSESNLLFWGDIQNHSGSEYLAAIGRLAPGTMEPTGLDKMLAEQIVINAEIAAWKYGCFKFSLWLTLIALLTPVGAAITYFTFHHSANRT